VGPGGRAQAGGALAQRALAGGRLLRQETAESTMALGAANALWVTGRYAQSEWALGELIAEAQDRGSVRGFALGTVNRAYGRYLRGWLREAEADAEAYSALFAESRWPIFEPTAAAVLASVRLERGDLEGAQRSVAPLEQVRDDDLGTMQFLNLARAAVALARGDNKGALADLELCRSFEEGFRGGAGLACLVPWRSREALAHLGLGDSDTAGALAAEEVRLAREFGAGRPLGVALCVLATIEEGDRGIELLAEAVSVLETADSQVEYARALTDLGGALRRAGNRLEARERLMAGMDIAHRAGATVLARRAREELVAGGARPRRLAASGPDALTASERRVATMAADGMGNREIAQGLFVTVRTVEGHLTNAFAKLEISSRDELGDLMAKAEATA
jgi:ATP/maltotriose-dependent transcriptional regulator MalT